LFLKPKYYALVEFPYPSGQGLHVGHPRPYTALDIVARKRRLVLKMIYIILSNYLRVNLVLNSIVLCWKTKCIPTWTQWIFLKLFKAGLAYKQEMPINWCTSCKVGLANEEVVNGVCERCQMNNQLTEAGP